MEPVLKAGFAGVIIAFVITFAFFQFNLYFFPSFVASLIVIYFFELKATKDAVLAAFIVYIFTEWILSSLSFLVSIDQTFSITVDAGMALGQISTPLTALVAGFIGAEFAKTRRHIISTLQPLPPPPPPSSPQAVPSTQNAEVRFCRYCGEAAKPDAVFCEKCGRPIR